MSDNFLSYVPVDSRFRPDKPTADGALLALRAYLPDAESISVEFFDEVTFIDCGENWSGVACPACGSDVEDWWGEAMSTSAESKFENLGVITPCCDTATLLSELHYGWPIAFGRFMLEAMNPNSTGLSVPQIQHLSTLLGCPIREVALRI